MKGMLRVSPVEWSIRPEFGSIVVTAVCQSDPSKSAVVVVRLQETK